MPGVRDFDTSVVPNRQLRILRMNRWMIGTLVRMGILEIGERLRQVGSRSRITREIDMKCWKSDREWWSKKAISLHVWGICVLVLRRNGHEPLIYIGSGTATTRGVRARLDGYDRRVLLPSTSPQGPERWLHNCPRSFAPLLP